MFAVDTHAHVFSSTDSCIETARYTPDYDATVEQYIAHLDQHGLSHGVLVQPSFFGTDNHVMLSAIAQYPERLKGIAVVPHTIGMDEMIALNAQGIVGVRLNLFGLELPDLSSAEWKAFLNHLTFIGWQLELHAPPAYLIQILPQLTGYKLNIVIDHFGRTDPVKGVQDSDYQQFLKLLNPDQHWIKVSGFYRLGQMPENLATATQAYTLLKEQGMLHKLVWGSDWPHTQNETKVSYALAFASFKQIVPSVQEQQLILADNAQQLFPF